MKDENIKKKYEEFIEDFKEYFISNDELCNNNLQLLKDFINIHKKRPSDSSIIENEKILGSWLSTQQKNYKNNEYIMKEENIKRKYEEFIENYKQYFISNDESWNNNLQLLKNFIDINKKKPSNVSIIENEKILGNWLSTQQTNYKSNKQIMKEENIRKKYEEFIENYKQYFVSNYELWNKNLQLLKDFIDTNKKTPSTISKISNEKILGIWLSGQLRSYKNNEYIMKEDIIKKKYEEFIENYKQYLLSNDEIWDNNLQLSKDFIDIYKKRPSTKSKISNEKILGEWLSTQQKNYKNNEYIMKDENIKEKYEEFIEDYKQYFISNDELWKNNLLLLKNFIDINNKKPSTISKIYNEKILHSWMSSQQTNYKNNKKIMKEEKIKKKYEEFIENYKQYFK
jgi:hypothetical protein